MPNKDGTGPRGTGPKKVNRGTPTPMRKRVKLRRGGSTKRNCNR